MDPVEAVKWYRTAAEKGNVAAQEALKRLHLYENAIIGRTGVMGSARYSNRWSVRWITSNERYAC